MSKATTDQKLALWGLGALSLGLQACEASAPDEPSPAASFRGEEAVEPLHGTEVPPPAGVGVVLADPPTSEPEARGEVMALVFNTGEKPVQAEIFAVGLGLDGQAASVSLGVVELEPGHEAEVGIPVDAIPLQAIGHAGQMRFEALVDRGEETVVPSRSQRVFLDYTEDYSEALVYDETGAIARNAELDEQGPPEVLGRFLDASGAWREVQDGDTYRAPAKWGPAGKTPVDIEPPEPPKDGYTTQACGMWMSAYVDDQVGEDLLSAPQFEVSWAAYASASIRAKGTYTPIWSGHLGHDGCAPVLELDPGQYQLVLRSSFEGPQSQHVDVLYNYLIVDGPQGESISEYVLGFEVDPMWGSTKLNLYTINTPVANVAAIISAVLRRTDNGLPAASYTIHSNIDCPGLPGNACAPGTTMYLGTGPWGTSDDEWKFVVAHELGHNAQSVATGMPGSAFGYDSVIDNNEAACRCDHVTVANGLHCLQSLEHVSKAQVEGFAQYFAARTFNTSGSDCGFAYYKEFLDVHYANGNTYYVTAFPPIPIDCSVDHDWRSTYCSEIEDSGTELDWMTAFRALELGGVTLTDLYAVYTVACGGFGCGPTNVRWDDLAAAAAIHYGSPAHPKAQLFVQVGAQHDVD